MNDIAVQQGMFRVSSIRAAGGEEEGFLVLVADCRSKYPYTMDITSDQGPAEVLVHPQLNEDGTYRSLHLDDGKPGQLTRITLPAYTRGWHLISDGGRYSIRVIAWQADRPDGWQEIWREE